MGLLGQKLLRPVIEPVDVLRSLARYTEFLGDLRRYSRMEDAEPIRSQDLQPCLGGKTPATAIDPHYFFLNIWAASRVLQTAPAVHVDVGSSAMLVGFLTCFTQIVHVDLRPLRVQVRGLEGRRGDILSLPFEDESIGSLSCLHVAEHVGLGRYGDRLDPRGTEKAAKELIRVLARGGNLFFALPVGQPRVCFNAHRIHASHQIMRYFSELKMMEFCGVNDRGEYREGMAVDALDESRYGCGFFWFQNSTTPPGSSVGGEMRVERCGSGV